MANVIITTYDGFQSTPPRGRRLRKRDLWRMRGRYFNPLRREGGDLADHFLYGFLLISIHSAARAETFIRDTVLSKLDISIHSAARAETAAFL